MTHDAFAGKLLDLAYGELSPREARKVEAHAASCGGCRAELARIRETRSVMARLPDEPAPESGERILFAAAREAAEKRAAPRRLPRSFWSFAAVAASLVAVAGVSFRLGELRSGPAKPDSEALLGEPYAEAPPAASPAAPAPRSAQAPAAAPEVAGAPERAQDRAAPEADEARQAMPRGDEPAGAPAKPERKMGAPARPAPQSRAFAEAPPATAPGDAEGRAAARREEVQRSDSASDARLAAAPRPPAAAPPPPAAAAPSAATEAPAVAAAPSAAASAPAPQAASDAAPTGRMRSVESEARGVRRSAPAAKAGQAEAEPRAMALGSPRPGGALTRTFDRCEGESSRTVELDEQGRVRMYAREGRIGGRRVRVVHAFGADGSLASATAQDLDEGGPPVDARKLGVEPVRRAQDAGIDAPPRCGP
jgi:Putative zinc-finger